MNALPGFPDLAGLSAVLIDVVLIKGTAFVLAAAIVCRLLGRASASVRHGVWAALFAVLLALPVARWARPDPGVTLLGVTVETPPSTAARTPPLTVPSPVPPVAREGRSPRIREAPGHPPDAGDRPATPVGLGGLSPWIAGGWLLGLLFHVGGLVTQRAAARRLRLSSRPLPDRVARRVRRVAAEIGLSRVPTLVTSDELEVPGTFGLLRSHLAFPADVGDWPAERIDAAACHELTHLRRRDHATHLAVSLAGAVYWPNPLVRHAARRLEVERERACDDGVVADRVDPVRYAEYLVALARDRRSAAVPVLPFSGRSSLAERVRSVLDRAQRRDPLGRRGRIATVAIAGAGLLAGVAVEGFGVSRQDVRPVGTALEDPDPLVRRHAAWAAGESEDPAHVDALIARIADRDVRVRATAAWALGEIKDPRAIAPLATLLDDEDGRMREMAALAIGEIEDPAGLAALRAIPETRVSDEARGWAIAQIERRTGAREPDAREPDVPEVFAGAFGVPFAEPGRLGEYLADLGASDAATRRLAAEALGRLGDPRAVDPLLDALEDAEPAVRAMAIWALDEINPSRPAEPRAGPLSPEPAR